MSKNNAYFSVTPLGVSYDAKRLRQAFHRSCDGVLAGGEHMSKNNAYFSVTPQMLRDCLTGLGYTVDRARMEYNL